MAPTVLKMCSNDRSRKEPHISPCTVLKRVWKQFPVDDLPSHYDFVPSIVFKKWNHIYIYIYIYTYTYIYISMNICIYIYIPVRVGWMVVGGGGERWGTVVGGGGTNKASTATVTDTSAICPIGRAPWTQRASELAPKHLF